MRARAWSILLIAIAALALPQGLRLSVRPIESVEHACVGGCDCTVQNSCGCISESPEAPEPSPQAPTPVRVKLIEIALDRAPTNPFEMFQIHAAPLMMALTRRHTGEREPGRRVHDALAMKGVWRT